ncbi:hypothetical protein ACFWB1_37425 [Streptomyces goshikiensis]|uniref:hypothetical protein n=1 Tax=Streptomyces goshikiensis TaxID=1942 RepID=UPI0036A735FD
MERGTAACAAVSRDRASQGGPDFGVPFPQAAADAGGGDGAHQVQGRRGGGVGGFGLVGAEVGGGQGYLVEGPAADLFDGPVGDAPLG